MLTHNELVRAIRFMIAAEYESIQIYTQLAESTDNKLAQEVLLDITNEEKEHAGEFLRLLQVLAPDEQGFYDEGMGETNEKIEKLEERQNNLEELTKAFSVMQNEQEHIKTDVGEIKEDVKQLVSKPAKRYDAIIDKVVLSLVGAFVGFVLCKIGM